MCRRNCVEKLVERDGKDAACPVCCTKVRSWFASQMLVPAASHVSAAALIASLIPMLGGCCLEQSKILEAHMHLLCFTYRELLRVCCQVTMKLMHAFSIFKHCCAKRWCKPFLSSNRALQHSLSGPCNHHCFCCLQMEGYVTGFHTLKPSKLALGAPS